MSIKNDFCSSLICRYIVQTLKPCIKTRVWSPNSITQFSVQQFRILHNLSYQIEKSSRNQILHVTQEYQYNVSHNIRLLLCLVGTKESVYHTTIRRRKKQRDLEKFEKRVAGKRQRKDKSECTLNGPSDILAQRMS